jgi:hypothetical protein
LGRERRLRVELTSEIIVARAAIANAARALVERRIGIIEAARAIGPRCHIVDPSLDDDQLNTFILIDSDSDGLAIGELLDQWHPDVREAKKSEVGEFEKFYDEIARRDALVLAQRYAIPA